MAKPALAYAILGSRNGLRIVAVTTITAQWVYGRDEQGKPVRMAAEWYITDRATEAEAQALVEAAQAAEREHRPAWQAAFQAEVAARQVMTDAAYRVLKGQDPYD